MRPLRRGILLTLTEAQKHIGDAVVYDDGHGAREDGTITRVLGPYVMVRYSHNDNSIKATLPEHLTLLAGMGK